MMVEKKRIVLPDEVMKVAVYCRVSTKHESQVYSFDRQVEYFNDLLIDRPNWEPVLYCDKGISGTKTKNRKAFLQMMDDVRKGMYKLVISREVSRIARNTMDSLDAENDIKKANALFWFPEEDMWSTDPDFDIKFQKKSVAAQEFSKEQSKKVKNGLALARKGGMIPGNGNILGYELVNKNLVVNTEQAETVQMIFKWALERMGLREIKDKLERLGRKTSAGKTHWHEKTISQVLQNITYTGVIVYNKQYSDGYLEQNRIKNNGEVYQERYQGTYEPLVSAEDFEEVQKIIKEKTNNNDSRKNGKRESNSIWSRKLVCKCGHRFNHIKWGKKTDGTKRYGFICNLFAREGSVENREARNVDPSVTCTVRSFAENKLWMMIESILMSLHLDRQAIMDVVYKLIDKSVYSDHRESVLEELKKIDQKIATLGSRLDNLISQRADAKNIILIAHYENNISDCVAEIEDVTNKKQELSNVDFTTEEANIRDRIKLLKERADILFDLEKRAIPETIIDSIVREVKVYEEHFEFNLCITNDTNIVYECKTEGGKKKYYIVITDAYRKLNTEAI